ncbi:MAG TPA: hypothetical protein VN520_13725 [Streptomyces sp.]|uniref:hypothetical protein n=1 Tax=Streptomyces sp. TaxID=1931 RepID=UPI002D00377F|nr:hypothetical protein [Streptomyces sp.]HWU07414.1 hypothetical protein [Streptomyces sp.]
MSDSQTDSHSPAQRPADGSDAVLAELHREYSTKLATAELKAHAAQAGINLPNGFTDYLDASKLLGEDGNPSNEAITKALTPLMPKTEFPQIAGTGYYRHNPVPVRRVSLDVRNR